MSEARDEATARTQRRLAKAGATAVLAMLLTVWWGWTFLEAFGANFGSTGRGGPASDIRTLFAVLGTGVLGLVLLVVLAAGRIRTIAVASSAAPLGLLGVLLLRALLSPLLYEAHGAWEARREANHLEHVESMCAFHIPTDDQGVGYHYVWDGDLLIELKLWDTVVQSNPVGERDQDAFRFWRLTSDFGDMAQERLDRAQAAVDPTGRPGLDAYRLVLHDQSKAAYRAALSEAQRTYNR